MSFTRPTLLLLILFAGCIDPLPYQADAVETAMVVDGMITDQPGPYTVKLFMSADPSAGQESAEMIEGASVWILDDEAKAFELAGIKPGIYSSDPSQLRGEVGRTYSLRVILADGTEYQSLEETIVPSGQLDSLYYEYNVNAINQTDPTLPQDAISFYVDARSDPVNSTGLQRWRSTGIYEILTYPELRTRIDSGVEVPDPLPCSGYINENDRLKQIDTCSCCNCWVYEHPGNVAVSSGQLTRGNVYKKVFVARIPVDRWRFFRKYYLEVEQLSVSENVFEFWKRISAQQKGTGSLFQPNAVKVKGNIRSVNNPGKEVLGIFSAYSVTRMSVFITRGELPYPVQQPDTVKFDCRYPIENSSNVRPPFW